MRHRKGSYRAAPPSRPSPALTEGEHVIIERVPATAEPYAPPAYQPAAETGIVADQGKCDDPRTASWITPAY